MFYKIKKFKGCIRYGGTVRQVYVKILRSFVELNRPKRIFDDCHV